MRAVSIFQGYFIEGNNPVMNLRSQRAISRRLLLVAGVLLAIAYILHPRPVIYRVAAADFAEKQKNRPAWHSERQLSLSDYIKKTTEDRLLIVEDQAWLDLRHRCQAATDWILLAPSEMPWTIEQAHQARDFTYIQMHENGVPVYLDVTAVRPGDYTPVPADIRYPLRSRGLWVLIVAVLGYILIPWNKSDPQVVDYQSFRGALLPDILGVMFLVLFFGLPWLIVSSTSGVSNPLNPEGMPVITIVLWFMSLFGLALIAVAARYEAWHLKVLPNELRINALTGTDSLAFTDIESLTEEPYKPPKALVRWGLFMGLINWRALGPTLLVASRNDFQIVITLKDGTTRKFVRTCLRNIEAVVTACKATGITVDVEL